MTINAKTKIKRVGWIGHDHAAGETCPDGGARCGSEAWGGEPGTLAHVEEQAQLEVGVNASDDTICRSVRVEAHGDGTATVHAYYSRSKES